ncbi:MAG: hypothetical protein QM755_12140 [Luteolibacter sp.]
MKPRFSKILVPAVLAGLAVSALLIHQGRRSDATAGDGKPPAPKPHVLSRDESRAAREDDTKTDAVMARLRVADKAALWNGVAWTGQNPADFAVKKVGDEVSLDLGNGKPMSGKVFMSSPSPAGGTIVGIDFGKEASTLHVRVERDGSLFGDLVPKDSLSSYRWSGKVDAPVFKRMAQTELLCASIEGDDHDSHVVRGMPTNPIAAAAGTTKAAASAAPQALELPTFNSRPGAKGCIYLDFDGQVVTGSRWNSAAEPTLTAAAVTYSKDEMTSICQVIAEDYAPFDVTVTTDEAVFTATASTRRMRVIFTPTQLSFLAPVGGIAYLGSFADGSGDPCWVNTQGTGDAYGSALAGSHETGHTFGLSHDGLTTQSNPEYYQTGNGAWGPIMGAPYGIAIVQFSNGDYTGATNFEDDLAIISSAGNGVGYIKDDVGDTPATASTLTKNTAGSLAVSGLITTNTDIDYYTFSTTGGNIQINVKSPSPSPNLNALATLYDSNGQVILVSNPAGAMTAAINQTVPAGTYRLSIEGAAEGTYDTGGYSKYGSVGPYTLSGVVPGLGAGAVAITDPTVDGVSIRDGHGVYLTGSAPGLNSTTKIVWSQLSGPAGGTTTFSSPAALSTRASFNKTGVYNIQLKVTTNGSVSTDTVRVSVEGINDIRTFTNLGPVLTVTSATEFYTYDGNLSGAAIDDGVPVVGAAPAIRWEVTSGAATLQNPTKTTTPVTFATAGAFKVSLSASDGQVRTFREVPLNVSVRKINAAVTGTVAKYLIPTNGSLANTWVQPGFNDSGWATASLPFGYNNKTLYKADLIGGTDFKTKLYNKGTNVFVRAPFQLRSTDYVTSVHLKIKYDDGFILYLNGKEIARRNVQAGIPAWDSGTVKRTDAEVVAPLDIDLTTFKLPDSTPIKDILVDGTNVVAIQAINSKKNDLNFLLAPQFEVQIADTPYYRNVVEASAGASLPLSSLAPGADADSDGVSNLVEHALGRDPFVAGPATTGALVPVPGKAGTLDMTLPISVPNDVQYILERSYDLSKWTQIAVKNGTSEWTTNGVTFTATTVNPATSTITYRVVEGSTPLSAQYQLRYVLIGPTIAP